MHIQPTMGLKPKMAKVLHQSSKSKAQASTPNMNTKPYQPILMPSSSTTTPQRTHKQVTVASNRKGVSKSPQLRSQ